MSGIGFESELRGMVRGVIQVGMGSGYAELRYWNHFNVEHQLLFEPYLPYFDNMVSEIKSILKSKPHLHIKPFCIALSDKDGRRAFNVNSCADSHSLLKTNPNNEEFPWMNDVSTVDVLTLTLDTVGLLYGIDFNNYNTLYMDTQGTELNVLIGFSENLRKMDYVVTEVCIAPFYQNQYTLADMDGFLSQYDFERVRYHEVAAEVSGKTVLSHADVLYARKGVSLANATGEWNPQTGPIPVAVG